jgi:hypothetical protein
LNVRFRPSTAIGVDTRLTTAAAQKRGRGGRAMAT